MPEVKINLPDDDHAHLKKLAAADSRSLTKYVSRLLHGLLLRPELIPTILMASISPTVPATPAITPAPLNMNSEAEDEEARLLRNAYVKEWRRNHPEKVKAINARFYKKLKERSAE